MSDGRNSTVVRHFGRIFGPGTATGLSDGQLLDRFASGRDEAAFEALLIRHGPMVLGTCRALLPDPNDADDAFQATFLVLARRAGAVHVRGSLGPWLHGVSHRVARRGRADRARRNSRLGDADLASLPGPPPDSDLADLRRALHEEVGRLPEKYRAPIVLCYLEGLTHDEAAASLRWPVGTVRGRLSRARDLLRPRLLRRGLAPSAALLTATLSEVSARAALPMTLLELTASAASRYAASRLALAGTASAAAATLAKGVLRTMLVSKLNVAAAVALVVGLTAAGTRVVARQDVAGDPESKQVTAGKAFLTYELTASHKKPLLSQRVTFQIKVTNSGSSPARQVVAQVKLSRGLKHREDSNTIELDVGTVDPGKTISLAPLEATAIASGNQICSVTTSGPDLNLSANSSTALIIQVALEGLPDPRFHPNQLNGLPDSTQINESTIPDPIPTSKHRPHQGWRSPKFEGRTVSEVRIRGLVQTPIEAVLRVIRTRPGQPYSLQQSEADIKAIEKKLAVKNMRQSVVLDDEPPWSGVIVTFWVKDASARTRRQIPEELLRSMGYESPRNPEAADQSAATGSQTVDDRVADLKPAADRPGAKRDTTKLLTRNYDVKGLGRDPSDPDKIANLSPITDFITSTIAPGTWVVISAGMKDDGEASQDKGAIGTIAPYFAEERIVVRHTEEVHRRIADLLGLLRRLRDGKHSAVSDPKPPAELIPAAGLIQAG